MANANNANAPVAPPPPPPPAPAVNMTNAQLQQIIQAAAPAAAPARRKAEKRLSPFTTGRDVDWLAWKANYVRVAALNGWDEDEKRHQILASMEGLACRLIQTVQVDNPPLTSDEIIAAFEARFLPPAAGQMAKEDFNEARQRRTETVNAWHTRIVEIFLRAYPTRDLDTDSQLIEKFIGGIYHPTVQERTFVAQPTTMLDALNIATSMVAAVRLIHSHSKAPLTAADRDLLASLRSPDDRGERRRG